MAQGDWATQVANLAERVAQLEVENDLRREADATEHWGAAGEWAEEVATGNGNTLERDLGHVIDESAAGPVQPARTNTGQRGPQGGGPQVHGLGRQGSLPPTERSEQQRQQQLQQQAAQEAEALYGAWPGRGPTAMGHPVQHAPVGVSLWGLHPCEEPCFFGIIASAVDSYRHQLAP